MLNKENKTRIVYGICGEKFHGKDFLASLIKQKNDAFEILHFADELKRLCSLVFGVPKNFFSDSKLKEKNISPIDIDHSLPSLEKEVELSLPRLQRKASSARELMQLVGTEYIRSVQDDYWVNFIKRKIENNSEGRFIVADVRYPNEEEMIKFFGKTIETKRIDFSSTQRDTHSSEAVNLLNPDLVIGSLTNKFSLPETVAGLLAVNNWDEANKYNYNNLSLAVDIYSRSKSLERVSEALFNSKDIDVVKNIFDYYQISYS